MTREQQHMIDVATHIASQPVSSEQRAADVLREELAALLGDVLVLTGDTTIQTRLTPDEALRLAYALKLARRGL
jgi:hypothetical protein